jgi:hypothetical protein
MSLLAGYFRYVCYSPIIDMETDPTCVLLRVALERKVDYYYTQVSLPMFLIVGG